jgi:hypothetical protein
MFFSFSCLFLFAQRTSVLVRVCFRGQAVFGFMRFFDFPQEQACGPTPVFLTSTAALLCCHDCSPLGLGWMSV